MKTRCYISDDKIYAFEFVFFQYIHTLFNYIFQRTITSALDNSFVFMRKMLVLSTLEGTTNHRLSAPSYSGKYLTYACDTLIYLEWNFFAMVSIELIASIAISGVFRFLLLYYAYHLLDTLDFNTHVAHWLFFRI